MFNFEWLFESICWTPWDVSCQCFNRFIAFYSRSNPLNWFYSCLGLFQNFWVVEGFFFTVALWINSYIWKNSIINKIFIRALCQYGLASHHSNMMIKFCITNLAYIIGNILVLKLDFFQWLNFLQWRLMALIWKEWCPSFWLFFWYFVCEINQRYLLSVLQIGKLIIFWQRLLQYLFIKINTHRLLFNMRQYCIETTGLLPNFLWSHLAPEFSLSWQFLRSKSFLTIHQYARIVFYLLLNFRGGFTFAIFVSFFHQFACFYTGEVIEDFHFGWLIINTSITGVLQRLIHWQIRHPYSLNFWRYWHIKFCIDNLQRIPWIIKWLNFHWFWNHRKSETFFMFCWGFKVDKVCL